jgi:DNA repair protein RadC
MKKYKTIRRIKLISEPTDIPNVKITTSKDAYEYMKHFYFEDVTIFESAFILLLNKSNITTSYVKISQGGTIGTVIDGKLIAKYAIDDLAQGVILVHNHPSGNLSPSTEDINITKKVKESLAILDIKLLDHIIFTTMGYTSMADEGLL